MKRLAIGLICAAALGTAAAPAWAAPGDPLYVFTPTEIPNPEGGTIDIELDGPCGVAVDSAARLYASSYYRDAIMVFEVTSPSPVLPQYLTQRAGIDPLGGPCGMAVGPGPSGTLYVNSFHRNVEVFAPAKFPPIEGTQYASAGLLDSEYPTGVAVDSATGDVYVNRRTHVAVYDSSGAPVLDEGGPLEIGHGSLGDGYGLAVSAFPATAGRVYVADAAADTVKAYDPAVDPDEPAQTIDGAATPNGGFVSLRDSALAVDRVQGEVFVLDDLQPEHTERAQSAVYVFGDDGGYHGRLRHNVIGATPSGLAIDNSTASSQGRVYVSSGDGPRGSVYAYPPNSAIEEEFPPLEAPELPLPSSALAGPSSPPAAAPAPAGAAAFAPASASAAPAPSAQVSEIVQKSGIRVRVSGGISPRRLPRHGVAPVAVSIGGRISTADGSPPPQLRGLRIELNRHGRLEDNGLPICPYRKIQPASTARALAACRSALVGQGRFEANIVLSGQEPYPTQGRLLVFNGRRGKRPVLFGHIYSAKPFTTSFVLVFEIGKKRRGRYGTVLRSRLPRALGNWGYLTGIDLRLWRRYAHRGKRRSYISAGCPAPKGFPGALFPLARTTFSFAGGGKLTSTLMRSCRVLG
ncbi:MAG: hypothetical protein WD649_04530 [Thermoleophilaceae bacterium]